jgi:hypothetical protein
VDYIMSLVLQSSSGGQITVQEPATASNFTQTLPAATGTVMVSGNMPAFNAFASTTQSISGATWTKVNFANERFDTNNNFASSRFTPTVAGYYLFTANVYFGSNPSVAILNLSINGNGSDGIGLNRMTISGAGQVSGSTLFYMNGTTDYAEIFFYSSNANTLSDSSAQTLVTFAGFLARAA